MPDLIPQSEPQEPGAHETVQPKRDWRSKTRAMAIHLALSSAVFAVLLYLLLAHWFPGFHFAVDGGWQGVRILVGVDLVLGPLLTLLIFDRRKSRREITLDLSLIALIQLGALSWGVHTIYQQRVAAMAFHQGSLWVVYAADLRAQEVDLAELNQYSDARPPLIFMREAIREDRSLQRAIELAPLPYESYAHLYANWQDHFADALLTGELDITLAGREFPAYQSAIEAWLIRIGRDLSNTHFLSYKGRYANRTLAFDRNGTLLAALPHYD